jgi:oligoendopeptidase F
MTKVKQLPPRSKVKPADTWDLTSLFPSDEAWEAAFTAWEGRIAEYAQHQGKLGESAEALAACLAFDLEMDRAVDRIGNYAGLKVAEDVSQSQYQRMQGRFMNVVSQAAQAASFIRPEILAIPAAKMKIFLESPALAPYKLILARLLRYKPHTLGKREENLLAMQTEMAQTANLVFRQLNDADLKFGTVRNEKGEVVELSHATFGAMLHSPSRPLRRKVFHQYYTQYSAHAHTLAAALNGSIQGDIYAARARNYKTALEAALFPDQVPVKVYDNLIASVHGHLPALHHYYDVRRRKMKLKDIHHYDTYVPILSDLQKRHTWDQAVTLVIKSLAPLGSEYCGVLEQGLRGRWCDRYENRGKQSGAFSSGSYDGDPYILMNYQADVLDHVFTLTHEAGHSMHSHYSAKNQPFAHYNYVIFVAEVASTFNEQLLSGHMLSNARNKTERAYLLNRQIDAMRSTIFRQTMFAEFEKLSHASAEAGEPLTLDRFQEIYRELLKAYFGPEFILDDELSLECFRIPHFYRAFYVYKYATGMSAAIALAQRVVSGVPGALESYLNFLKGGNSKDPLDLLRDAGVDMEQPAAVDAALAEFGRLVEEFDKLV